MEEGLCGKRSGRRGAHGSIGSYLLRRQSYCEVPVQLHLSVWETSAHAALELDRADSVEWTGPMPAMRGLHLSIASFASSAMQSQMHREASRGSEGPVFSQ